MIHPNKLRNYYTILIYNGIFEIGEVHSKLKIIILNCINLYRNIIIRVFLLSCTVRREENTVIKRRTHWL